MEIRYFFISNYVKRNKIAIKHCPTDDMMADYFTKPLQGSKFRKFRAFMLNLPEPTISREPHYTFDKENKKKAQECVEKCEGTHILRENRTRIPGEFSTVLSTFGDCENAGESADPPASYKDALLNRRREDRVVPRAPSGEPGNLWPPRGTTYLSARW